MRGTWARVGGRRPLSRLEPRAARTFRRWQNPPDQPSSARLPAAAGGPGLPAFAATRARRTPVASRPRPGAPEAAPSGGMEAEGDPEELARLRAVFAACDANRSGRLERDEFSALCAELRVRPADAEAVFQRLDSDRDGAITFQEFARGFRGARRGGRRRGCGLRAGSAPPESQAGSDSGDSEEDEDDQDTAAEVLAAPWGSAGPGPAWRDFQARLGEEAKFIPRCVSGLEGGRYKWCLLCRPTEPSLLGELLFSIH